MIQSGLPYLAPSPNSLKYPSSTHKVAVRNTYTTLPYTYNFEWRRHDNISPCRVNSNCQLWANCLVGWNVVWTHGLWNLCLFTSVFVCLRACLCLSVCLPPPPPLSLSLFLSLPQTHRHTYIHLLTYAYHERHKERMWGWGGVGVADDRSMHYSQVIAKNI